MSRRPRSCVARQHSADQAQRPDAAGSHSAASLGQNDGPAMNHHHKDLRRMARSAECSTAGESATPPEVIEAMVRKARQAGVVVFLRAELERMPDMARALIEGEHRRICERGGR